MKASAWLLLFAVVWVFIAILAMVFKSDYMNGIIISSVFVAASRLAVEIENLRAGE
jgi:hypothetical protein